MRNRQTDDPLWAWSDALDLLQGSAGLRRRLVALAGQSALPCWEPPMDIYERDGELTLVLALPGVSAEHIEVLLDGEHLIVRGERPIPHAVRNSYIHRLEMPYGRFERNIVLPAGTFEAAARQFENGCLTLVFKPRRGA